MYMTQPLLLKGSVSQLFLNLAECKKRQAWFSLCACESFVGGMVGHVWWNVKKNMAWRSLFPGSFRGYLSWLLLIWEENRFY